MSYIAHTGTFDVENYGDLLFPLIARLHLPDQVMRAISPVGGGPVWSDCVPSEPIYALTGSACRGVVVGGGNIVHANRSSLVAYETGGVSATGYADLWIGAALAAGRDMPVVWNAPGVPKPIRPQHVTIARKALLRTNYLSVRDTLSKSYLLEVCSDVDIAVVPDSAWDIPALWSGRDLDEAFAALTSRQPGDRGRFVTIHLNRRYTRDIGDAGLAGVIDALCEMLDAMPILVAIGPCHGDDLFAREIAARLSKHPIVIDRPKSLRQVCAAISRSMLYCGSSMHGYITAASFGVPALLVANKMIKFAGAVERAGAPHTLVPSWKKVVSTGKSLDLAALSETFRRSQKAAAAELATHWRTIAEHLDKGDIDATAIWEPRAFTEYRTAFEAIPNHGGGAVGRVRRLVQWARRSLLDSKS